MRIVAGALRGRKIITPEDDKTRPTLDVVRQAVFTSLQFYVGNSCVLDLFGGSGAMAIEALSRGAKEATICDKNSSAINIIKQNLTALDLEANVLQMDYKNALFFLAQQNKKFDIIILDPPYANGYYEDCFNLIFDNKLLSNDGIIVCERAKKEVIKTEKFNLTSSKNYGTVCIDYYENN